MRRIDPVDAVVYMLAQLSGAVLGALLVKGLLLDEGRAADYGAVEVVSPLLGGNFAGGVVEALGAFLLVLAVLAVAMNPRARQEWAPLAIGTTLGFVVMIFGPLTGGSFNPARWFGPALIGELESTAASGRLRRSAPLLGAAGGGRRLPVRDRGPQYARGRRAADRATRAASRRRSRTPRSASATVRRPRSAGRPAWPAVAAGSFPA